MKKLRISFPDRFTFDELSGQYPSITPITLRYLLGMEIDARRITQVGKLDRPTGRPHVIYGKTNL